MNDTASRPHLGLLLDVDGPIASPVTRRISHPEIAPLLVEFAALGTPIVFNTGRSDAFLREIVMPVLREHGLPADARVYGVSEKGAVWFRFADEALHVDERLAVPDSVRERLRNLVRDEFEAFMFFDDTKRTMVSVEQRPEVATDDYRPAQQRFDARAAEIMREAGLDAVREGRTDLSRASGKGWRIDPTIISTDIEHVDTGKDLGATRALELIEADGAPLPTAWRTLGDSRSDYAMAEWLHEHGFAVVHGDVRPSDGAMPADCEVITSDAGINDAAGADLLARWLAEARPHHG